MKFHPIMHHYGHQFKTIDSHTMGEYTRIVCEGIPELKGTTMMEKKHDLEAHYDDCRRELILEPRGHHDMFGAILTEPVHPGADFGVIFMDNDGYLNMCGHGSIGVATAAVETNLVKVTEPYTDIALDTPAGLVHTRVKVSNGRAEEVTLRNVPSFLYRKDASVELGNFGRVFFDIAFGGNFFAILEASSVGLELNMDNLENIIHVGMDLLEQANRTLEIRHPYLDIHTLDLVEFYCPPSNPLADKKNVVVFGNDQIDRSPCGTGTSAKIATLYAKGELALNQTFVHESILGTLFRGKAVEEIDVGGYRGIIPEITGSAYLTGINNWIVDDADPLKKGFFVGKTKM